MSDSSKKFFKEQRKYKIGYPIYQKGGCFTVEELYQAFKLRMTAERRKTHV